MIPIYKFTQELIPEPYRQVGEVYQLAKSIAVLSVCLRVIYTSVGKNDHSLHSDRDYPLYEREADGYQWLSITTGRICDVRQSTEGNCFCGECIYSKNPSKVWWSIKVFPSTQNNHDYKEAKEITCILFLDGGNADKSVPLIGGRKIWTLLGNDFCCLFETAICNEALARKLLVEVEKFNANWQFLYSMYENDTNRMKLVIVVNHPYGIEKRIYVGLAVDIGREFNLGYSKFSYLTPMVCCSNREPFYILGYNFQETASVNGGSAVKKMICECSLCKHRRVVEPSRKTSIYYSSIKDIKWKTPFRKEKDNAEEHNQSGAVSKPMSINLPHTSEVNDDTLFDLQHVSDMEDNSDLIFQTEAKHAPDSGLSHASHSDTKPKYDSHQERSLKENLASDYKSMSDQKEMSPSGTNYSSVIDFESDSMFQLKLYSAVQAGTFNVTAPSTRLKAIISMPLSDHQPKRAVIIRSPTQMQSAPASRQQSFVHHDPKSI